MLILLTNIYISVQLVQFTLVQFYLRDVHYIVTNKERLLSCTYDCFFNFKASAISSQLVSCMYV